VSTFDILMLIALPVLVVGSAFFSGSETALFSLTAHQRAQMAQASGPVAAALHALLRETRGLLITLLLGNMTINVLFFVISSMLLIRLGDHWSTPTATQTTVLAVAAVAPLLCVILLGEVLPKQVAARMTMGWARLCAVPLLLAHRLVAPVRFIAATTVITPLAQLIAPREKPPELSAEELESMLDLSQRHGVIDADEERLLQQVLELSRLKTRDLATPRVDVESFDLSDPPEALCALVRKTRHEHIFVHRGGLDHVEGMIHRRQALLHPPASGLEVHALVRPAAFIPEQQRADRLMDEFRRLDVAIAVVVDEYGGTVGIIGVADVLEHMAGGLRSGGDRSHDPDVTQVAPGRWRVDADLSIHDWPDWFGRGQKLDGDANRGGISTIGGLVMASLGRVPEAGDATRFGNVRFVVESMDGLRVERVLIELAPDEAEARP